MVNTSTIPSLQCQLRLERAHHRRMKNKKFFAAAKAKAKARKPQQQKKGNGNG